MRPLSGASLPPKRALLALTHLWRRLRATASAGSIAAGVLANPAHAADGDQEEPPAIIVVTGNALPETPAAPAYGTQILGTEQLQSTGSGRIETALASVASFQQFRRSDSRSSNPSAQGVTLRALGGNASSRALVLLDGVPMADPFFGAVPFSAIAPERLLSARITRGGGSGPFGAGALTGIIELSSASGGANGSILGQHLMNDRGETETSVTFAPKLGGGFVSISGRLDRGRGFFTTPRAQRVPATVPAAYDAWSTQARAVAPLSETMELQARVLAFRDARTLRFRGADTATEGQDASLRLIGLGRWQFDLLGYVQARDFSNVVISSSTFTPTLDQRNTPATGIGGKFELRPPMGESDVLRLGIDYRKSIGQLHENALSTVTGAATQRRDAGGVNTDVGLFVENDLTLSSITLTAGFRIDRTAIRDGFFTARTPAGVTLSHLIYPERGEWTTSFRGGAVVPVGDEVRLRIAAYTGLRLPTLNELYRPFTVFPVITQANADLRNERLEGVEVGADFAQSDAIELSVTAFDNRVKDAIANVTIDTNLRQRQNIEAIRSRGIEARAGLRLGKLGLAGSLAYTDAETIGSGAASALDGKRPAQTPRWVATGGLTWRPSENALVALNVRHVGSQFEDDLETEVLPPATTVDGFAQIPLTDRLALVVRGENVTDARIATRNQAGSIDLGTPRTVWVGLKFRR